MWYRIQIRSKCGRLNFPKTLTKSYIWSQTTFENGQIFTIWPQKGKFPTLCYCIFCPFKLNSRGVLYFAVCGVCNCIICVVDYGAHMGKIMYCITTEDRGRVSVGYMSARGRCGTHGTNFFKWAYNPDYPAKVAEILFSWRFMDQNFSFQVL